MGALEEVEALQVAASIRYLSLAGKLILLYEIYQRIDVRALLGSAKS